MALTVEIVPLAPNARIRNLAGQRFGILTAIRCVGRQIAPSGASRVIWLCRCDCGSERQIPASSFCGSKRPRRSCGCQRGANISAAKVRHGYARRGVRRSEYRIWSLIVQRCANPRNPAFADYGGRGVGICERWAESFEAFLADMGSRPSPKHTVSRIEGGQGYHPGNCYWATPLQRANNTRANHRVTFNGETMTLAEWARRTGVQIGTLSARFQAGWDVERALTVMPAVEVSQPIKLKARIAVNCAVARKELARVTAIACGGEGCGRRAAEYHHHKGYEPEHWLDVVPLCKPCHEKAHHS